METVSIIYTKMSTLSPIYAKSRHVYILVQDFHLFSAMPKSVLFEIYFISYRHKSKNATLILQISENGATVTPPLAKWLRRSSEICTYFFFTSNLYPIPLTVCMYSGCRGSISILFRKL